MLARQVVLYFIYLFIWYVRFYFVFVFVFVFVFFCFVWIWGKCVGRREANQQGRDEEDRLPPCRRAADRVRAHALLRRAQDGVHIIAGGVRHGLRVLRYGAGV